MNRALAGEIGREAASFKASRGVNGNPHAAGAAAMAAHPVSPLG